MSKVTVLNAEKKIFLYESTIAEELAMSAAMDEETALHAMASVCGCVMINVTEAAIAALHVVCPTAPIKETGSYIVLIEEFSGALSEDERRAVIAHEIGHIEHAHLEGRDGEGVVLQLEFELEADRAAAKAVSASAMASAIVKLINRSHDIQQEYLAKNADRDLKIFKGPATIENSRHACLNHEIILKRLAALQ